MSSGNSNASPAYIAFLFIGGGIVMLISQWYPLIGWSVICLGLSILFGNVAASSHGNGSSFPVIIAIASFVAFVILLVIATT